MPSFFYWGLFCREHQRDRLASVPGDIADKVSGQFGFALFLQPI